MNLLYFYRGQYPTYIKLDTFIYVGYALYKYLKGVNMRLPIPDINYEPPDMSELERRQQTELIMNLFAKWNLTYKQQAIVLGLSPKTDTGIHRYKTGKQFLPQYRDIQDRISYLLAIHKLLRRAYAFNIELAYQWILAPNEDFNNKCPYDIICAKGYLGLVEIKEYLELNQQ